MQLRREFLNTRQLSRSGYFTINRDVPQIATGQTDSSLASRVGSLAEIVSALCCGQ
jgi:hypothetical protein